MKGLDRVVLLEGIEGTGKTTLGKKLSELGWGYIHFSFWPHGNPLQYWFADVQKALSSSTNNSVVIDRMYISNRVYGNMVRGEPEIDDFQAWLIDGWLCARQGRVYFFDVFNLDYTANRIQEKFNGVFDVDSLKKGFEKELDNRDITNLYRTDCTDDDLVDNINNMDVAPVFSDNGIGSLDPKIWIIKSDYICGDYTGEFKVPFYYKDNGYRIYKIIKVSGVRWRDIHISNAYDLNGEAFNLTHKWEFLGKPHILVVDKYNISDIIYDIPDKFIHYLEDMEFKDEGPEIIDYARKVKDINELR